MHVTVDFVYLACKRSVSCVYKSSLSLRDSQCIRSHPLDKAVTVRAKLANSLHPFLQRFLPRDAMHPCLQCFDAVGWAAGRASGL